MAMQFSVSCFARDLARSEHNLLRLRDYQKGLHASIAAGQLTPFFSRTFFQMCQSFHLARFFVIIVRRLLEENPFLLRMEIFVGTYMRRRYSPCQSLRELPKKLKSCLFCVKGPYWGFLIPCLVKKCCVVFCLKRFETIQTKILTFYRKKPD